MLTVSPASPTPPSALRVKGDGVAIERRPHHFLQLHGAKARVALGQPAQALKPAAVSSHVVAKLPGLDCVEYRPLDLLHVVAPDFRFVTVTP